MSDEPDYVPPPNIAYPPTRRMVALTGEPGPMRGQWDEKLAQDGGQSKRGR